MKTMLKLLMCISALVGIFTLNPIFILIAIFLFLILN